MKSAYMKKHEESLAYFRPKTEKDMDNYEWAKEFLRKNDRNSYASSSRSKGNRDSDAFKRNRSLDSSAELARDRKRYHREDDRYHSSSSRRRESPNMKPARDDYRRSGRSRRDSHHERPREIPYKGRQKDDKEREVPYKGR